MIEILWLPVLNLFADKIVHTASAFPLMNVLAVLDGKEEIATPVFLFLVVHMDTVFKPLNVFVILAMAEDFVMFVSTYL